MFYNHMTQTVVPAATAVHDMLIFMHSFSYVIVSKAFGQGISTTRRDS